MSDHRRQHLVEQYEDIALSLLMDNYAKEEGKRLLHAFDEAEKSGDCPEVSEELDKKCRRLIENEFSRRERNTLFSRIGKAALRAAIYACVFLGLSTVAVLSVEALRVPVLNFIIQQTDRYSVLTADDQNDSNPSQEDNLVDRISALVPDEYVLVVEDHGMDSRFMLYYQDPDGHIISFFAIPSTETNSIDTENASITEVKLYDYNAILVEKDGLRLVWGNPETQMIFDLYSDGLDANSFWELAYALAE